MQVDDERGEKEHEYEEDYGDGGEAAGWGVGEDGYEGGAEVDGEQE